MQSPFNEIPYFGSGTTQPSRLAAELLPEYVQVDDRSTAELLAQTAQYARLLKYYNLENEPSGDWEKFWLSDVSVILADVVSADLEKIEREHNSSVNAIQQAHRLADKKKHLTLLLKQILTLASRMEAWRKSLSKLYFTGGDIEKDAHLDLEDIINIQLKPIFQEYLALVENAQKKGVIENEKFEISHFDKIWTEGERTEQDEMIQGKTPFELSQNLLLQARLLFRRFYNVFAYSVYHFEKYFNLSLEQKHDHAPHIGLFLSFLELFSHVQKDLNYVSNRYLDFYYSKILGVKRRGAISDEVHVCANLSGQADEVLLPAGTLLHAGTYPDGESIVFKTDYPIVVNNTTVEAVKTVYVSRFERDVFSDYELVSGIYAAPQAKSKDGLGTPLDNRSNEWPLFGEEQANRTEDIRTMADAEVGFAVSTPVLFLAEGEREVTLTMRFLEASTKIYEKLVRDVARKRECNLKEAFEYVLNRSNDSKNLDLWLTGAKGWFKIPQSLLKINIPDDESKIFSELTIQFTLPPAMPAVTGYNGEYYEEKFFTKFPILKILLSNRIQPYLYSFLNVLQLAHIQIDTKVSKAKKLRVFTEFGEADTSQPYYPLGPQPTIGSGFSIGNTELFVKKINNLQLDFVWNSMPDLSRHYQAYNLEVEESLYKIKVQALSGGEYNPARVEDYEQFNLFKEIEREEAERLYPGDDRVYRVNLDANYLDRLDILPDAEMSELPYLDNDAKDGYLRFELLAPDFAFAHQEYSKKYVEVVTYNAQLEADEEQKSVPEMPYTPQLKTIYFSYSASAYLTGRESDTMKLFHLHPFGNTSVYSRGQHLGGDDGLCLLPQFKDNGFLYLGLKNLYVPQTVNFLFQLTASRSTVDIKSQLPAIRWRYLANDRWYDLEESAILFDTTDNFTRSGIVSVELPRTFNQRNSSMPSGLHWLCIAVSGDTRLLCYGVNIHTQAVKASWVQREDSSRLYSSLPPKSIERLENQISEIQSVNQFYPSFGGLPAEDDNMFYKRVSERLRHKQRAVSSWDFERLVLDRFHTIFQAKCLTHTAHPELVEPGEVQIIVLPRRSDSTDDKRPRANYVVLQQVQEFLAAHASPFLKIKVRNPDYEYARIVCDVKFIPGLNNGATLQRLKEDIRQFICPWQYDENIAIPVGSSINEDVVLNFIKALDYVQFVTKFSILHFFRDGERYSYQDTADPDIIKRQEKPWTLRAKPWSVLIPDEDHKFHVLDADAEEYERSPAPSLDVEFSRVEGSVLKFVGKMFKIQRRVADDSKTDSNKKEDGVFVVDIRI